MGGQRKQEVDMIQSEEKRDEETAVAAEMLCRCRRYFPCFFAVAYPPRRKCLKIESETKVTAATEIMVKRGHRKSRKLKTKVKHRKRGEYWMHWSKIRSPILIHTTPFVLPLLNSDKLER